MLNNVKANGSRRGLSKFLSRTKPKPKWQSSKQMTEDDYRLGSRDYARFDFRANSNGEIKLLEANPNLDWCWDG
jgi:hypothetical protein